MSDAPNSISGSTSSADGAESVGTVAESGRASALVLPGEADVALANGAAGVEGDGVSGTRSSKTPCASSSASESSGCFEAGAGVGG